MLEKFMRGHLGPFRWPWTAWYASFLYVDEEKRAIKYINRKLNKYQRELRDLCNVPKAVYLQDLFEACYRLQDARWHLKKALEKIEREL